jgi:DivIVA domain-containing protein
VTSNGQRFRRRSLRRGYKVDEVDRFLDRVEATLNGESVSSPVRSHDVHDAVFKVRFGGYDEWQVDLHLDRVERQLADQETTSGTPGRAPERPVDRMPERMAPERMAPPMAERLQAQSGSAPLPTRSPMGSGIGGSQPAPAAGGFGGYNEPTYAPTSGNRPPMPPPPGGFNNGQQPPAPAGPPGYDPSRHGRMDMTTEMRMPDLRPSAGPPGAPPPMPDRTSSIPTGHSGLPTREPSMPPPAMGPIGGPNSGSRPAAPPRTGNEPTGSIPVAGRGAPTGSIPAVGGPHSGGGFAGGASAPGAMNPNSMRGGGSASPGDVQRIDQMRRTFQLRRFGSGYDRTEVDRLFEGVIATMTGRAAAPVNESQLDPGQFNLVPGGYFEAEVDQALREARDILRRR